MCFWVSRRVVFRLVLYKIDINNLKKCLINIKLKPHDSY